MKVVHINTSGVGGAAIACHRLHHLMLKNGIQSRVIHLYDNHKQEDEFHQVGYKVIRRYSNHLIYKVVQKDLLPEAYVFSECAPMSSGIANHLLVKDADIIYLHWVLGGFFSKSDFEEIAKLAVTVEGRQPLPGMYKCTRKCTEHSPVHGLIYKKRRFFSTICDVSHFKFAGPTKCKCFLNLAYRNLTQASLHLL